MPAVVEDGSIVPGANAYFDAAAARLYFADQFHAASVLALTDAQLDQLAVTASGLIDAITLWPGELVEPDQPMLWPRDGVYRSRTVLWGWTQIPPPLIRAAMELARHLVTTDPLATPAGQVKREKLAVMEVEYFKGDAPSTYPALIWRLVAQITPALAHLATEGGAVIVAGAQERT